jgi:predicted PurR-regulated permease PerM
MAEKKETTDTGAAALFLRTLLMSVALIGLLLGMRAAQELLAPHFLDVVLALLFAPLLRWLERKGLPGWLALLVLTLLLVVFLLILLLVLAVSLSQLEARLPIYQALLMRRLSALEAMLANLGINAKAGISRNLTNESTLLRTAITAITGVLSNLAEVLFYVFLLFLMLASSRSLAEKARARLADGHPFALHFSAYAQQIQKQYRIQALSNFLCATGITIALLLFRIDFALLWGFLAFILAFIPNIGLILATLPAILLALILYGPITALLIAVIVTLINAAMDNLVTPRFMGSGLNLPMLAIFLSFLIWSWVFGLLGALLAVPITLLIRTLLRSRAETGHLAIFLEKSSAPPRTERGS